MPGNIAFLPVKILKTIRETLSKKYMAFQAVGIQFCTVVII